MILIKLQRKNLKMMKWRIYYLKLNQIKVTSVYLIF